MQKIEANCIYNIKKKISKKRNSFFWVSKSRGISCGVMNNLALNLRSRDVNNNNLMDADR